MKKYLFIPVICLIGLQAFAQRRTDLNDLKLNENPATVANVTGLYKWVMFDKPTMVSYGIEDKKLAFNNYVPDHVELMVYKGQVAGYEFKITNFQDQEKIRTQLQQKYAGLKAVRSLHGITNYSYKNDKVIIDFSTASSALFEQKAYGYLNLKRLDFYNEYQSLMKKITKAR